MNWRRLLLGIITINIIAWGMLEFWIARYSEGVAELGAGFMVFFQLIGYYIITIASNLPKIEPEVKEKPIQPQDCSVHDWQKHPDEVLKEQCMICKSVRKENYK